MIFLTNYVLHNISLLDGLWYFQNDVLSPMQIWKLWIQLYLHKLTYFDHVIGIHMWSIYIVFIITQQLKKYRGVCKISDFF